MKILKTLLVSTILITPIVSFAARGGVNSYDQAVQGQTSAFNTYDEAVDNQQAQFIGKKIPDENSEGNLEKQTDCNNDVCVDVHSQDPTDRTEKELDALG